MNLATEEKTKLARLRTLLDGYRDGGLIVAFSGGVDSGFLLWAAATSNLAGHGRLLAVTTVSSSVPQRDIDDATRFAKAIGVNQELIKSSEFEDDRYLRNDRLRCYFCKSELFRITDTFVKEKGYKHVAYGYTSSDLGDYRPGHQAALEHGVCYPLAELDFAKDEIRSHMRAMDFNLADKPASPCLSSRVMTGVRISLTMLNDIEELEDLLREGGLRVFRVRHHDDGQSRFVRLEVDVKEMPQVLALRDSFTTEAKRRGYRWVTLDLAGYRTGGANR